MKKGVHFDILLKYDNLIWKHWSVLLSDAKGDTKKLTHGFVENYDFLHDTCAGDDQKATTLIVKVYVCGEYEGWV